MTVLFFLFASGGFIAVSEQTWFCNSCHIINTYYASWQISGHSDVNCLECHLQPGFAGHIRGKINGLAQAVDCIVGRCSGQFRVGVLDSFGSVFWTVSGWWPRPCPRRVTAVTSRERARNIFLSGRVKPGNYMIEFPPGSMSWSNRCQRKQIVIAFREIPRLWPKPDYSCMRWPPTAVVESITSNIRKPCCCGLMRLSLPWSKGL
ncbi:MAG: NapC/NirT family cytochrome c [Sedimentisphaerales bacterium]|nr:NapC/NirT family cytochrome c [Sedimentisphaerales bacterium]